MEIKNLYTIKKIIETGSYSKAAEELKYAQSTVTFQVHQVEQELGIHIFEKIGKSMQLTSAGKQSIPLIDDVINRFERLKSINEERLSGTLAIAVPESLVTYKLQPVLKAFKQQAPNVELSIKVLNCYRIFDEVIKNQVDIGIAYHVKNNDQLVIKPLAEYELTLVGSKGLNLEDRDFITPNQKKPICHIQNDPDALYLKYFNQYLAAQNINLMPSLDLWSIEAIKKSVISNMGVAFLPKFTLQQELASGDLIELNTEIHDYQFQAVVLYNQNKWINPAMNLFLDLLNKVGIN